MYERKNRQAVGGACSESWSATGGVMSACLLLGRGTQLAEMLATICCVPGAVITLNVVAVKGIDTFR